MSSTSKANDQAPTPDEARAAVRAALIDGVGKFNLGVARFCAVLAREAYRRSDIRDEITDTQLAISSTGAKIYIAFRGTSNLHDFITDAKAWRTRVSCGEVHQGFWEAWLGIKLKLIGELNDTRVPIIVTGHSLGGALALICAKFLAVNKYNVEAVYTFGCPRVGDFPFQINYDDVAMLGGALGERTFTVINDCDIVPRLPGYLSGYRRPGRDVFIPAGGRSLWLDPTVMMRLKSDLRSLWRAWRARKTPLVIDELLEDHKIAHYIVALNRIARGGVA